MNGLSYLAGLLGLVILIEALWECRTALPEWKNRRGWVNLAKYHWRSLFRAAIGLFFVIAIAPVW